MFWCSCQVNTTSTRQIQSIQRTQQWFRSHSACVRAPRISVGAQFSKAGQWVTVRPMPKGTTAESSPILVPSSLERISVSSGLSTSLAKSTAHGLQAMRQPFCVTVIAARADLRATGDRPPSGVGPHDRQIRPAPLPVSSGRRVCLFDGSLCYVFC